MGIDTKTSEELLNHLYEDQPFPLYDASKREEVLDEFRLLRESKSVLDAAEVASPSQESLDFVFDLAQEQRQNASWFSNLSSVKNYKTYFGLAASFLVLIAVGFFVQNERAAQEKALANEEIRQILEQTQKDELQLSPWNDDTQELEYLRMRTQDMQRVSDSVAWDEFNLPRQIPPQTLQGSLHQAGTQE